MILSFTGVVQSIVNSTFLATYTENENDVPLRPMQSTAPSVHGNSSTNTYSSHFDTTNNAWLVEACIGAPPNSVNNRFQKHRRGALLQRLSFESLEDRNVVNGEIAVKERTFRTMTHQSQFLPLFFPSNRTANGWKWQTIDPT